MYTLVYSYLPFVERVYRARSRLALENPFWPRPQHASVPRRFCTDQSLLSWLVSFFIGSDDRCVLERRRLTLRLSSKVVDPSPGDLEAIAEELGPAGAKLLKEIYEEQAADAAPDL